MTHRASLRPTFAAVLTLLFVMARPATETAVACDCMRLKPLSPAVRTEAAVIFEGRVTEIVERNEQTLITRADGGESRSRMPIPAAAQ